MSNFDIFLELLKFLFVGFEIVRYFVNRKKEKKLIDSVERFNQLFIQLEKSSEEKSSDD